MGAKIHANLLRAGYCVVELVFTLSLLAVCAATGFAFAHAAFAREEARGSAQSLQAAAAWAQLGVLWYGGQTDLHCALDRLELRHNTGSCGGDLGALGPGSLVETNVERWQETDGIGVAFGGPLASPDSGGSLYLICGGGSYRVTVRPESGLTTRMWTER
jgi:hypothetical protein